MRLEAFICGGRNTDWRFGQAEARRYRRTFAWARNPYHNSSGKEYGANHEYRSDADQQGSDDYS